MEMTCERMALNMIKTMVKRFFDSHSGYGCYLDEDYATNAQQLLKDIWVCLLESEPKSEN
jgi:hypothetical protein